jgi:glycosyltransferase involved in cell wall biosynthesis
MADVAIVHDYLNQRGGAERTVLELSDMWPSAPIYTSLYRSRSTFPGFEGRDIRTSPLDRLPVDRGFRNLFPLYPWAFRSFGSIDADVVIASSSGWAHLAGTTDRALHVVYCHTPARWLYGREYLGASRRQRLASPLFGLLRRMDKKAALRADVYVANSANVRRRIRDAYGIDAVVVPPPVDVDRFTPRPRGERLLVVSRLLPYKRVDAIVAAATRGGIGLDVVGTGPMIERLRSAAGPEVTFHGTLDDDAVTELMEGCRALFLGGEEDFGMTPVEANSAGKPVIALGRGGALETVEEGISGVFFQDHDPETILEAIRRCDELEADPARLAAQAQRFSPTAFRANLMRVIENALQARRSP